MENSKSLERSFVAPINTNVALLRVAGVISLRDQVSPPGTRSSPLARRLRGQNVLAGIAFVCVSIYTVSYVYEFASNGILADTAAASFTMTISFVGCECRYLILLRFRDEFQRMFDVCRTLWSTLDAKEKERVAKYANINEKIVRCYLVVCYSTIFFYGLAGLTAALGIGDGASAVENASSVPMTMEPPQRKLPYAFVLEIHETPYYEIAYAFQLGTLSIVALTVVATDTICSLFVLIACGHLEVVRARIDRLQSLAESGAIFSDREEHDQHGNLRSSLRYHLLLLEFCQDIERRAGLFFLTQLLGNTYNIALVGFKLVGNDPDRYKYVTQLGLAVIPLFVCCWAPDVLLSESEAIGRAAYGMPWYRYPAWLKHPTTILLVRSQRPNRLTACKFVALSLETFASTISTAASFFTMVNSVNGGN